MKIYIQSNKFQNIVNVAKYSFERFGHDVKIISVEENELLVKYLNKNTEKWKIIYLKMTCNHSHF